MMGKEKGKFEIQVKDGDGSKAGKQEVPEDACGPSSAEACDYYTVQVNVLVAHESQFCRST